MGRQTLIDPDRFHATSNLPTQALTLPCPLVRRASVGPPPGR